MALLKIDGVSLDGDRGVFRADETQLGFKGSQGSILVYPGDSLQVAEWLEGELRMLFQNEDVHRQILKLQDFKASDYEKLWEHFQTNFDVYIKRPKQIVRFSSADLDVVITKLERSADRVDEAQPSSVKKRGAEADLMKTVEAARDILREAVAGDKHQLSDVFSAKGCERVGRLRLVVDTIQLEVYAADQRWRDMSGLCTSIECVLRDLGTYRRWKPARDDGSEEAQRQMVRELRRQISDVESEDTDAPQTDSEKLRQQQEQLLQQQHRQQQEQIRQQQLQQTSAVKCLKGTAAPLDPLSRAGHDGYHSAQAYDDGFRWSQVVSREGDREKTNLQPASHPVTRSVKPAASLKEGWLYKQSRFLKIWRRRWFVLTPEGLRSFKWEGDMKPTEFFEASQILGVHGAEQETGLRLSFAVRVGGQNFLLSSDHEGQKDEWMKMIEQTYCHRA